LSSLSEAPKLRACDSARLRLLSFVERDRRGESRTVKVTRRREIFVTYVSLTTYK
jgi:hypothetical protein